MIIGLTIVGSVLILVGAFWDKIPNLPSYPAELITSLNYFLDVMFDNIGLLNIFIHINTIKIVIPLLIAIINFEKIYNLIKWVMNKIPFLDLD